MISFDNALVQGPLAGYSCSAMRRLVWQNSWASSSADFCWSEMLSAKHLASGAPQKARYRHVDPREGKLCVQLSGDQVDSMQLAAERVASWGAHYIDINCGCPKQKIRRKHCGSKLLADSRNLAKLIQAAHRASGLPVLIKIRVDADSGDQYNLDVARSAEDAGAAAISVHGRHWRHDYSVPVFYADIAAIKQAVTIPVIGNGDVASAQDVKFMRQHTGCDAVMISRAGMGQPWLFAQINAELQGRAFKLPTKPQIGALLLEHIHALIALEGEVPALLQARSIARYYARSQLTNKDIFLRQVYSCQSLPQFINIVAEHFAINRMQ